MDAADASWQKVFKEWQRFPSHVREKFEMADLDGCSPQQPAAEEVPATDTTSQSLTHEDAMETIDPVT